MTSARNTFFIVGVCIIGVCIVGVCIVYMLITKNTSSNSKHNNFANIPYGYLNFDIYSVPGTKMDPYILYGPGYLPYESNVPAVDILRANGSKKTIPAYYKQYINHNTSPLAARNS
jgi:hypothetical protein